MSTALFCPTCGAANESSALHCFACQQPLQPSSHVRDSSALLNARYQILAEVGTGGFGAVYKAQDTHQDNQLVAIKQINLRNLSSQEIIEATDGFNREAQILAALSHPQLPRILDRFSDSEHWYLVMDFIDGQTLEEYVLAQHPNGTSASNGLPLEEVLRIGLQLCDVLQYLHSQQPPIIFRDLKPGDILRTRSGTLFLIDFGIARQFKPGQAKDTIPFGSPGFAAPEQYGRAQTTPRADIYSLGALLHTLISGDDPSEHSFQFSPLRLSGIDGMRELDALIQRMVELAPENRPASIQEVQNELQQIQQIHRQASQRRTWTPPQGQTPQPMDLVSGAGQQHIFATPSSGPRRLSRRNAIALGAGLSGALIFGGSMALRAITAPSKPYGVSPAVVTAIVKNAEATATANAQIPAAPTNGPTYWFSDMRYAVVVNLNREQFEVYDARTSVPRQIIKTSLPPTSLSIEWSPDNNTFFFWLYSGALSGWDVRTGRRLFTNLNLGDQTDTTTAWAANGTYLALSYADFNGNTLFTLLTNDGKKVFQKSFPGNSIPCLAWSSDGRYIAFPGTDTSNWFSSKPWSVEIWDSKTHRKTRTIGGRLPSDDWHNDYNYEISALAWSLNGQQLAISTDTGIWLYDLTNDTCNYRFTDSFDAQQSNSLIWSPNNSYLAALSDASLTVWDAISGQSVPLNGSVDPTNSVAAFAWSDDSQSIATANSNNVLSDCMVG